MVAAIRYNLSTTDSDSIFQVSCLLIRENLDMEEKQNLFKGVLLKIESMAQHHYSNHEKLTIELDLNQFQADDFVHNYLESKGYQDTSGCSVETDNEGEVVMILKYSKRLTSSSSGDDSLADMTVVEDSEGNGTELVNLMENLFSALHKEY